MNRHAFASCLALSLALLSPAPVFADDHHDHEQARKALEAGEIIPLRQVLDRVEKSHPGQVLEVELDKEDGRWVYEIKLLGAGDVMTRLELDARDGSVLREKSGHRGRHHREHGRDR